MNDKKAAVIDLGTNTSHLLMVELLDNGLEILYKEKLPVKIGKGGISQNRITDHAQKRAFHTIGHFKSLIDGEKIEQIHVFATSAVRNAVNGPDFAKDIQKRFDLKVNVINGDHEAQLIYEGIKLSGSLNGTTALMMDIGGGSVEFIIGNDKEAFWRQSFAIGGQRRLDLFTDHEPILPEEVDRLNVFLDQQLVPLVEAIQRYKPLQLVGASGTFDTLTDIYYASLNVSKSKGMNTFSLPLAAFAEMAEKLKTLNKSERLKIPGMIPMRVEMIVVAVCLIGNILRHFEAKELVCS